MSIMWSWIVSLQSSPDYHRSYHSRRSRSPSPAARRRFDNIEHLIVAMCGADAAPLPEEEDGHHLHSDGEEGITLLLTNFSLPCEIILSYTIVYVCLSVCLSVCLCLTVYLCVCVCVCVRSCVSVCLYVCLCVWMGVCGMHHCSVVIAAAADHNLCYVVDHLIVIIVHPIIADDHTHHPVINTLEGTVMCNATDMCWGRGQRGHITLLQLLCEAIILRF